MVYELGKLPLKNLLGPVADATALWARLDERIARSPIGPGWIERLHFSDACASLWIDGELVHLEDLVLHDAERDIRAPTHELTMARDVLKTRRRIALQPAGWALKAENIRNLQGLEIATPSASTDVLAEDSAAAWETKSIDDGEAPDPGDPLAAELAAIDAVLIRSEAAIAEAKAPDQRMRRERDPLVYDLDWDEDERIVEWQSVLQETEGLPPLLRAVLCLDAWNSLEVLQHMNWLGRLLAASILRQAGITTAGHLAAINYGLKAIPVDRRRHRDRTIRLLSLLEGISAGAAQGLKDHDRLLLARQVMERKLIDRRTSSRLPQLIDLVIARPLVSASMVASTLDVTPQAARRIVAELGLREMTGRGRFRAWGVL
ncbi:MAG: hypothetical protein RLZZ444_2351 [Pseudomonadota bacterium]